eukprot:355486-Chlamydomonas_euryale.AAC.2
MVGCLPDSVLSDPGFGRQGTAVLTRTDRKARCMWQAEALYLLVFPSSLKNGFIQSIADEDAAGQIWWDLSGTTPIDRLGWRWLSSSNGFFTLVAIRIVGLAAVLSWHQLPVNLHSGRSHLHLDVPADATNHRHVCACQTALAYHLAYSDCGVLPLQMPADRPGAWYVLAVVNIWFGGDVAHACVPMRAVLTPAWLPFMRRAGVLSGQANEDAER